MESGQSSSSSNPPIITNTTTAASKPCYNCVKRRIICDRTGTRCRKCAKKGLRCPGYGIRYRFAHEFRDQKPAAPGGTRPSSAVDYSGPLTWVVEAEPGSGPAVDTREDAESVGAVESVRGVRDDENESGDADSNAETPSSESTSDGDQYDQVATPDEPHIQSLVQRPRSLESIDANSRWMFQYFSEHVSPVMLLFNGASNGYRRYVLPLATSNRLVQRAVCVAAAFHLLPRRPELRAPAEQGRAAIIQRLREDGLSAAGAPVLDDATWATILLLIVGDLVSGDEQVMILYHMLDAFLRARGGNEPTSQLDKFLDSQSRLIKFFGDPIVSESNVPQRPDIGILPTLSGAELPSADTPHLLSYVRLYEEAFCVAMEIYMHRARSDVAPVCEDTMARRVRQLRSVLERIDPAYPGAHVIVWPSFVGAAEAEDEEHREYFTEKLRYIWQTTGYANVLKAIDSLPGMWAQRGVQRWTRRLPQVSVMIM
ncbi:hypothetical protein B0J13DRAFT_331822 [Dactylonectria estremocensis]|uniref:Zn(2)-C6 fungal-type domain-containing protein n=1 Tax=Dactylonectria estremocensis TaxID=1079267 RepID=A0A9P9J860_9HYPO|nr:hypothetical protein B0J13DRAFT_331822 [Dactylonectria estremocensis]